MKEFILIIDDDKDICKLLGIYLGNEGYRYLACENARKAMDVLEHYQVDLILLDVMMPGIDGISACLKIRETNKMPIIFMSAKSEDMDIIQGLTAGGDDAYCKSAQQIELGRCASRFYQNMLGKGVSDMADWRIIPGYILINSIVIAGTILVFFLVYRRLSVSFRKRLTAYFLRAACHSLVISLIVLAVEYLLFYYGLREFFYHLSLQHGAAAEYLHTVLTTAPSGMLCAVFFCQDQPQSKVRGVSFPGNSANP